MRESSSRGLTVLATVLSVASVGCADTVRPMLGGLTIGPASSPFHMPVLENERVPFAYPIQAWREGIGGETILRIHISPTGIVDSVRVGHSSGNASLDSAAVAGALKLRYRPARHGAEAIAVWGTLPVRFPMPAKVKEP
ncbi:MAG: energy transducer TonB [Gemmatimonadota bacterium]